MPENPVDVPNMKTHIPLPETPGRRTPQNPEAVRDVLAQESMGRVDIQSLPDKRRSLQIQGKSPPCDFGNEELGYGNGCLKKRKLNGNEDPIFAGEEIDSARRKREANATVHGEGGGRTGRRGWLRDEDDRLKLVRVRFTHAVHFLKVHVIEFIDCFPLVAPAGNP